MFDLINSYNTKKDLEKSLSRFNCLKIGYELLKKKKITH